MSENEVVVRRNGEETTIVDRYLSDFEKDGWVKVESKSNKLSQKQSQEQQAEDAEKAAEMERLIAKGRIAEQKEHEEAMLRIQAENQAAEDRRNDAVVKAQEAALENQKKDHEAHVLASEDKEEIAEYIEKNFEKKLDKRGNLDSVQEKALELIEKDHQEKVKSLAM